MPTVQVRFPPPLHERFIKECEKREITPSDFIRGLVDAALNYVDARSEVGTLLGMVARPGEIKVQPSDEFKPAGYALDGSDLKRSKPGSRLKK